LFQSISKQIEPILNQEEVIQDKDEVQKLVKGLLKLEKTKVKTEKLKKWTKKSNKFKTSLQILCRTLKRINNNKQLIILVHELKKKQKDLFK